MSFSYETPTKLKLQSLLSKGGIFIDDKELMKISREKKISFFKSVDSLLLKAFSEKLQKKHRLNKKTFNKLLVEYFDNLHYDLNA